MRLTEPKPTGKRQNPQGSQPDRLIQSLVAAAIILAALALILGADLWIRAPAGGLISQALRMALDPLPPTHRLKAAALPAVQVMAEAPTLVPSPVNIAALAGDTPPPCIPPDDWGLHLVQEGNTLQSLAARYGTDVQTLMVVNCLNTETIFVDQRLYVPGGLAFATLVAPLELAALAQVPTDVQEATTAPTPTNTPTESATAAPTSTPQPSETPTSLPTSTPLHTASATPAPTETPLTPTPYASEAASETPTRPSTPTQTPVSSGSPAALADQPATTDELPTATSVPAEPTVAPSAATSQTGGEPPTMTSLTVTATPNPGGPAALPAEPAPEPHVGVPAMPIPVPTAAGKTASRVNIPNRYLNIVLLGADKRPGSGAWRTDTMIIASIDVETHVVRLLSIPRDLWVYIPNHGHNRINTAELWGELAKRGTGTERVKQTIRYNLGIPIHYYARVDFKGFMKIIDSVGGVDIDVICPLPDIKLNPGLHHMDGKNALRYARSRKSTSDFDRGRRQRKVLQALWDQALTVDTIPRLPELWVTMADAFDTDLPLNQVVSLAYVGIQIRPQHILSAAIGRKHLRGWTTPQGAQVLLPREDELQAFLQTFYTPKGAAELDAVDKVRVQVLNGANRHQAEILAASALRWAGFKVVDSGQADHQDYSQTRIIVYEGDLFAGAEAAQQLGVPQASVQDLSSLDNKPRPSTPAEIQVILGKDYNPCQR